MHLRWAKFISADWLTVDVDWLTTDDDWLTIDVDWLTVGVDWLPAGVDWLPVGGEWLMLCTCAQMAGSGADWAPLAEALHLPWAKFIFPTAGTVPCLTLSTLHPKPQA